MVWLFKSQAKSNWVRITTTLGCLGTFLSNPKADLEIVQYGKYFLKSYCLWMGCDLTPLHIDIGGGMQPNLGMQTFIELCVFLCELAVCLGHVAKLL